MSLPEWVYSFAQYWKRVLKSSVEARELLTWLIALLAAVVGWILHWAGVWAGLSWVAYGIAGVLMLWGILWPPFKVHEEERVAHEAAQTKLSQELANEMTRLRYEFELERRGSPEGLKQLQIKNALEDLRGQLESRIKEISGMTSVGYIDSLGEPLEGRVHTQEQLVQTVNAMLDRTSLELVARVGAYLAENLDEEKAARFKSLAGIVITPPETGGTVEAVFINRQRLYVDHLRHWAKNLGEIIEGMEGAKARIEDRG